MFIQGATFIPDSRVHSLILFYSDPGECINLAYNVRVQCICLQTFVFSFLLLTLLQQVYRMDHWHSILCTGCQLFFLFGQLLGSIEHFFDQFFFIRQKAFLSLLHISYLFGFPSQVDKLAENQIQQYLTLLNTIFYNLVRLIHPLIICCFRCTYMVLLVVNEIGK